MRATTALLLVLLISAKAGAQTVDIYFIDTEGGQATLYVSPSGESMLVDTGNPGERDHDRIMEVIRTARLQRLDHVIITHYHGDHHGGLEALTQTIPIRNVTITARRSKSTVRTLRRTWHGTRKSFGTRTERS